jgi:hypothetical protein
MPEERFSDLSPAKRRFLQRMHELGFGRVEGLVVKRGEPAADPPPRVVKELKFGSRDPASPGELPSDFALREQWTEFYAALEEIGDGIVGLVQVKGGLPLLMHVEDRDS